MRTTWRNWCFSWEGIKLVWVGGRGHVRMTGGGVSCLMLEVWYHIPLSVYLVEKKGRESMIDGRNEQGPDKKHWALLKNVDFVLKVEKEPFKDT